VTGLGFLPPVQPNEESVLADCDAAVVSISVDNQILVHHIEKKSKKSARVELLFIIHYSFNMQRSKDDFFH
jgi:hypothetical protein